ncbi:MAG: acetyl-CoA hydrolase [Clostridiales bacterium]|nr:acetyl-CoA hydrolase [Candidatus Crickella merdequi]
MADFKFEPMRSLIYVDVAKEDYRPKLQRWLHKTHIPESISQFEPYVTKYAFYPSFPMPAGAENYGYSRFQLTEHHWLVSDLDPRLGIKALAETFPMDVLVWQGNIPEAALSGAPDPAEAEGDVGNNARQTNNAEGNPFIFAFLPMWWEKDIKGKGRNIEDGANYRFNMAIGFPEGVDKAEGEKWLFEEVVPVFEAAPEVTRIVASAVKKDINGCVMDWVLEVWVGCQSEWEKVFVEDVKSIRKPEWAMTDTFPYLKPRHNVISVAVADYTAFNNLTNYRGYITMR